MGHSPLKITACNTSSTVLRHQPVPPPLSSPHLKKRQNSSPFLLLLFFPTKKNLPGLHLFSLNCFLFLMLKASAGQPSSRLRCELFEQCSPCGCAQGWPQLPGHYRTLCVQTQEQDSSALPSWNRGTAQHGLTPGKANLPLGLVPVLQGLLAPELELCTLLTCLAPNGTWLQSLLRARTKHAQVCTQHLSQRLADSFPTQLGAQTSAGAGHQTAKEEWKTVTAGCPQPNWSHLSPFTE